MDGASKSEASILSVLQTEQTEQLGEEVRLIAGLQMGSESTPRKVASCQLIREHAH